MSDTRISRRGAFASLVGGWATLWFCSRASAAKPLASVQSSTDGAGDGVSTYTYDEQNRLLTVVDRHYGGATTTAF